MVLQELEHREREVETLDRIVKSNVHNAFASGPTGVMVATSSNGIEASSGVPAKLFV